MFVAEKKVTGPMLVCLILEIRRVAIVAILRQNLSPPVKTAYRTREKRALIAAVPVHHVKRPLRVKTAYRIKERKALIAVVPVHHVKRLQRAKMGYKTRRKRASIVVVPVRHVIVAECRSVFMRII